MADMVKGFFRDLEWATLKHYRDARLNIVSDNESYLKYIVIYNVIKKYIFKMVETGQTFTLETV